MLFSLRYNSWGRHRSSGLQIVLVSGFPVAADSTGYWIPCGCRQCWLMASLWLQTVLATGFTLAADSGG